MMIKKNIQRCCASALFCLSVVLLAACGGKAGTADGVDADAESVAQASPEADALLDRFETVTQHYVSAIEAGDKAAYETACDDYLVIRDSISELGRNVSGAQAERLQQLRSTLEDAHDKAFSAFAK